ncbi:MAG: M23 family metallopeptidase [Endomicrobium sp.]|nr:M23 family metallopeptidase [Endomicrobium sp.]
MKRIVLYHYFMKMLTKSKTWFKKRITILSGLDIANKVNTPIVCTANGKVVYLGWQSGYGNTIVIDHGHNYRTVYGHLSKRLIKPGFYVSRGQIIAKMRSTVSSTGFHLHYEVHFKGRAINPKPYLTNYFFAKSERNDNA